MNRLVPYLDLFMRLDDADLARLASVDVDLVATLRRQVVEIGEGLAHYLDLLPRLGDEELIRLTGASAKTIRFWRLCQPRTSPRPADMAARAEISSITPMPRPVEPAPPEPQAPAPTRDEAPTQMRRRTTGVGMQATLVAGGAPPRQPVANWSSEASPTSAATSITPPPHQLPTASWDTTSPTSGTETMVTPIGHTAEAMWGVEDAPSETSTLAASAARPQSARSRVNPSESQQAAARANDINGEPFPGYEWNSASADDESFALSDLDH